MKKRLIFFALCAAVLALCSCDRSSHTTDSLTVSKNPSAQGFSAERLARLDSLAQYYIDNEKAPNMVMLVGRHGEIVYDKAFGWKNRENDEHVDSHEIFRIASMSKGIVTVGLMTLYEQGKFLLDDPLYYYIPEFKEMQVIDSVDFKNRTYSTREAARPITIRQLLCHTSGITYGNISYNELYIPRTSTLEDITIEETVKRIASRPLDHDPGERYTYGMGIDVAGYLIEVLSGQPLDKFMREHVFEPLGMEDTYFYLPEEKKERLVTLYSKRSEHDSLSVSTDQVEQTFPVAGPQTCFLGGAGLCSTVYDYAKFCQMLLNKGEFNHHRILGRKTVEMMTTVNQLAENTTPSLNYRWGLGFQIHSPSDAAHKVTSVGEFGWSGMYGTHYGVDPVEDMFFILFTNVEPWYERDMAKEYFHVAVYQALAD